MSDRLQAAGQSLGLVGSGCLLALGGCAGFVVLVDLNGALGFLGAVAFLVGMGMFLIGVVRRMFGWDSSEK